MSVSPTARETRLLGDSYVTKTVTRCSLVQGFLRESFSEQIKIKVRLADELSLKLVRIYFQGIIFSNLGIHSKFINLTLWTFTIRKPSVSKCKHFSTISQ